MFRKLFTTAVLLLVLTASLAAAEMTADGLIAKYFAACGGEQSLRALKSMTMQGTMFTQGMSLGMKIQYVLPNKSFTEILMNGVPMQIIGANGKDAWMKGPMGTFYMTGEEKKQALRQADVFPLLNYKKNGAKVKYIGEDLVKGAKAYKLEYVAADMDTVTYYFDATTFQALKQKHGDATVTLSDYKKVGAVVMPFKINIQSAQQQLAMNIDTIAVDAIVPDSLFIMPKDAKPLDSLKAMGQGQGGGN